LPAWARATLDKHANNPRGERYTRAELERAETADPIWNAAQRQLVGDGRIHNYLRISNGRRRRVLRSTRWSSSTTSTRSMAAIRIRTPASAGRSACSIARGARSGPIFGTIRYMSSASTKRKLELSAYLARWS
jgi:deoxyribodipyrimidine photo-lyase